MPRQGIDRDAFVQRTAELKERYGHDKAAMSPVVDRLAHEFNLSRRTVINYLSRFGLSSPQLDHSDVIPRGIADQHRHSLEHQYLQRLNKLRLTGRMPSENHRMMAAFVWALTWYERGMACYYDPKRGFYYDKATSQWDNLGLLVRETEKYFDKSSTEYMVARAQQLLSTSEEFVPSLREQNTA